MSLCHNLKEANWLHDDQTIVENTWNLDEDVCARFKT